jgi:hypothetical protein
MPLQITLKTELLAGFGKLMLVTAPADREIERAKARR